ncbi:MAG: hypothetical protein ACM3YM_03005 [Sphingomonadales bacterium]
MAEDSEMLLQWAAEEFVAAGRAESAEERRCHRLQAEFLHALATELDRYPPSVPALTLEDSADVGQLLARAFTPESPRPDWTSPTRRGARRRPDR